MIVEPGNFKEKELKSRNSNSSFLLDVAICRFEVLLRIFKVYFRGHLDYVVVFRFIRLEGLNSGDLKVKIWKN
jgi:hypothetical protein